MPSHAAAAAVTEEVSFTAVPANRPNPSFDMPSMLPSVGNTSAATTLNREDDGDGLRHVLVARLDDGRRGGNGRPAANGRSHADERGYVRRHAQQLPYDVGHDERRGHGGADDGQRQGAHPGDFHEVQPEAQQDDRALQHLLAREGNARLRLAARGRLPCQCHEHARQNGEHRASHQRERESQNQQGRAMATQAANARTFSMQPDKGLFRASSFLRRVSCHMARQRCKSIARPPALPGIAACRNRRMRRRFTPRRSRRRRKGGFSAGPR